MGNFMLGLNVLFRTWGDSAFAAKVAPLMDAPPAIRAPVSEPAPPAKKEPGRGQALTLLALLQREGRLVDFLMEPVAAYSDAQIGAAVRTVHRDCAAALARLFALEPLRPEEEGAAVEVPPGYDPAQFRLLGNIPAGATVRGKLSHRGWKATRYELPDWSGRPEAAFVVAPCEVQV